MNNLIVTEEFPTMTTSNGSGRCHVYIINGPDFRESIVKKTCFLFNGIVDTINILDKDDSLKEYCKNNNIRRTRIQPGAYHSECFKLALDNTKIGDYIIFLDSDEVPSASLLKFIENTQYLKYKADIYHINMIPHFYNESTNHLFKLNPEEKPWYRPSLIRRSEGSYVRSLGRHSSIFSQTGSTIELEPTYYTIHCKNQSMIYFSTLAHGLMNPINHGTLESSPNHEKIKSFLDKHSIKVNDDRTLCRCLRDKGFLLELYDTLEKLDEPIVRDLRVFLQDFNGELKIYDFTKCNDKCCRHLQP